MAFSFTQHIGDGSTTTFTFSFTGPGVGYYDDDQIKVYVNDAPAAFTLTGDNQVTLTTAPDLNSRIWIKREPDITDTYTNFSRGNSFGKDNINRSFQQMLYLVQRIQDGFKEEGYYEKQDINLGGFKLTNLGLGTSGNDSATMSQLLSHFLSYGAAPILLTEEKILTSGQVEVSFGNELTFASFYISGVNVDSARLSSDQYSLDLGNSLVTLNNSYPEGTVITACYNDTGGSGLSLTVDTLFKNPKIGYRAFVTDSSLPAYGNFGEAVIGGGSYTVPLFYDGNNWLIG